MCPQYHVYQYHALSELLYNGDTLVNSHGPAAGSVAYLPRYEKCFVSYRPTDRHYFSHNAILPLGLLTSRRVFKTMLIPILTYAHRHWVNKYLLGQLADKPRGTHRKLSAQFSLNNVHKRGLKHHHFITPGSSRANILAQTRVPKARVGYKSRDFS